jgi:hypothetical protein
MNRLSYGKLIGGSGRSETTMPRQILVVFPAKRMYVYLTPL